METSSDTRLKGRLHGKVVARVGARLERYVEEHGLGEAYVATGFDLGAMPSVVVAPDLSFIHRDRLPADEGDDGYVLGAPDLAIEVVDADDSFQSVDALLGDLFGAGCRMVVLVNAKARTAHVFRTDGRGAKLTVEDLLDGGDVLPGWRLPLRELFE